MINYEEWKRLLDIEDAKDNGGTIKRSNSELCELYEIYKIYEPERIAVKRRILSRLSDPGYRLNKSCADLLVEKGMNAILSCNTLEQLQSAIVYANLIHKRLAGEIGMVNRTNFHSLIERSIGFAQCKIKVNAQQE